jgi:hypothetical protein
MELDHSRDDAGRRRLLGGDPGKITQVSLGFRADRGSLSFSTWS